MVHKRYLRASFLSDLCMRTYLDEMCLLLREMRVTMLVTVTRSECAASQRLETGTRIVCPEVPGAVQVCRSGQMRENTLSRPRRGSGTFFQVPFSKPLRAPRRPSGKSALHGALSSRHGMAGAPPGS